MIVRPQASMHCLSASVSEVWSVATSAVARLKAAIPTAPEYRKAGRHGLHFSIPAIPVTNGCDDAGPYAQKGLREKLDSWRQRRRGTCRCASDPGIQHGANAEANLMTAFNGDGDFKLGVPVGRLSR